MKGAKGQTPTSLPKGREVTARGCLQAQAALADLLLETNGNTTGWLAPLPLPLPLLSPLLPLLLVLMMVMMMTLLDRERRAGVRTGWMGEWPDHRCDAHQTEKSLATPRLRRIL